MYVKVRYTAQIKPTKSSVQCGENICVGEYNWHFKFHIKSYAVLKLLKNHKLASFAVLLYSIYNTGTYLVCFTFLWNY